MNKLMSKRGWALGGFLMVHAMDPFGGFKLLILPPTVSVRINSVQRSSQNTHG